MDPVAHTFVGAALAAAGLRRATPLAAAALVLGANAPDVDVFAYFAGSYEAIAFRRGWTHGVLAVALWPFVLAGLLLLWDRGVRRRRDPTATPARAGPLLAVSGLAVVTHPALDWLNNYGLRWLMPFDGQWFYGDALFIVDPWVWLILGGAAFLTFSRSRLALVCWTVFALVATWIVVGNAELVPPLMRALWVAGIAALLALRWALRAASPVALERAAQGALAVTAGYIIVMVASSAAARAEVRGAVVARGIVPEAVMVAPSPGDPFGGAVVVMTRDEYYTGRFNWLREPRLQLADERIPRPSGAVFAAAARVPDARSFLVWSRFPAIDVEVEPGGTTLVHFSDVRYRGGVGIAGPSVRLPAGALAGD
jgi:inner membrane protein